ncbi:hypothetical protein WJX82_008439 [Trebouxia sp. C0006]
MIFGHRYSALYLCPNSPVQRAVLDYADDSLKMTHYKFFLTVCSLKIIDIEVHKFLHRGQHQDPSPQRCQLGFSRVWEDGVSYVTFQHNSINEGRMIKVPRNSRHPQWCLHHLLELNDQWRNGKDNTRWYPQAKPIPFAPGRRGGPVVFSKRFTNQAMNSRLADAWKNVCKRANISSITYPLALVLKQEPLIEGIIY